MKRLLFLLALLLIGVALVQGCGGDKETATEDQENLAARVDDWTLDKAKVLEVIDQLPADKKARFDTPGGRAEIADRFIEEELFYREALKQRLENVDWVSEMIDDAKRRILIQAYFRENIDAEARPTEQEIHDYYESHADVYTLLEIVRAQHIFSKDKEKLEDIKDRILEGGEHFTTMAHMYSEDNVTKADGGNLGYFNPGGYIRGIGFSETLSDTIFKMELKTVYGPIKWEKGYSLIKVNEKRPASLKPYDEVKTEISELLTRQKLEDVKRAEVEKIVKNYKVHNYMESKYAAEQRSAEELFSFAQESEDPYARIRAFEEIVEKFPDDKFAAQALFMIGFVYMEELSDKVSADRYFTRVLYEYADSDVADSARWMLDNMNKPLPDFENIEDLNKKIKEGSQ